MHSSSASLRPRQRTFTSCTECRRRKQRCNQAKDRPCNNCARRYPPVICTYEGSSSPPPVDRVVDLRDNHAHSQQDRGRGSGSAVSGPAYMQSPPSNVSDTPVTSTSDGYYSSHGFYAAATTRADYRQYQGEGGSTANAQYVATSGSYAVDGGYYQDQPTYSVAGPTQGHTGYYPISDQQRTDWLSTNGDPTAFVGAGSDYYYVEPGPEDHTSTRR